MNNIDLKRLDLNLLLVFDVLMQERSVTRAAEQLGRTQSAISHALARLRDQLGDPLLVKQGGVMQPSPFAVQLVDEVRPILRSMERVLMPPEVFEPASSRRRFRVALPDFAPSLFPRIAKDFLYQAPHAVLEWYSLGEHVLDKVLQGHFDVCLGPAHLPRLDGIASVDVGALDWGCFVRRHHPAIESGWDTAAWQRYPHIAVRVGDTPNNPVGEQSQLQGLSRHVAVWVPKFAAIAPLLAQSDLIATMPKVLFQDSLTDHDLVALPVPFDQPPISQRVYWASRYESDSANRWLRAIVQTEFVALSRATAMESI